MSETKNSNLEFLTEHKATVDYRRTDRGHDLLTITIDRDSVQIQDNFMFFDKGVFVTFDFIKGQILEMEKCLYSSRVGIKGATFETNTKIKLGDYYLEGYRLIINK